MTIYFVYAHEADKREFTELASYKDAVTELMVLSDEQKPHAIFEYDGLKAQMVWFDKDNIITFYAHLFVSKEPVFFADQWHANDWIARHGEKNDDGTISLSGYDDTVSFVKGEIEIGNWLRG